MSGSAAALRSIVAREDEVHGDGADLAGAARRRDDRLHRIGIARARQQQAERLARERLRDRAADAAVGTGDERRPALEVHTTGTAADLTPDHRSPVLPV